MLAGIALLAVVLVCACRPRFLPEEDQGYAYVVAQLPYAASLERTDAVCEKIENILKSTPGVKSYTTVEGFSLLSQVQATYNAFFFVTLQPWDKRTGSDQQIKAISAHLNGELAKMPEATAAAFSPPSIPGVGTSGGFTFILEDRSGKQDASFLSQNLAKFMAAARKRPELAGLLTTYLPSVPQVFVKVDRDKVLKLGIPLTDVYTTLQTFMGGNFVNYFNRFGRQWQVYLEARINPAPAPKSPAVLRAQQQGTSGSPLGFHRIQYRTGPEFVMHYNEFTCAQINGGAAPGYSDGQATKALEEVFAQTMPPGIGHDYFGMSYQEQQAAAGVSPMFIFSLSLFCVFLILAAHLKAGHWPVSVLLGTPHRDPGRIPRANSAWISKQRLCPDRSDYVDRSRREECHPHRFLRQGGIREGEIHFRGCAFGSAHSVAAHLDDFFCFYPRLLSTLDRVRFWRRVAANPRHRGDRRHVGRNARGYFHCAGHFFHCRKTYRSFRQSETGRTHADTAGIELMLRFGQRSLSKALLDRLNHRLRSCARKSVGLSSRAGSVRRGVGLRYGRHFFRQGRGKPLHLHNCLGQRGNHFIGPRIAEALGSFCRILVAPQRPITILIWARARVLSDKDNARG